eukprot:TRINITY_DN13594_c0_g1_i1.p1 TRINITY_DN13594_c0_g1~~TRINITY_DN13594_c0_g1_i1.p1  ORF type:complete len:450 (+),score=47.93 TRINITY_DN13594_c0_g1_i1:70-1419(+)
MGNIPFFSKHTDEEEREPTGNIFMDFKTDFARMGFGKIDSVEELVVSKSKKTGDSFLEALLMTTNVRLLSAVWGLIPVDAWVNIGQDSGKDALRIASECNNIVAMSFLARIPVIMNRRDAKTLDTPLHASLKSRHLCDVATALIENCPRSVHEIRNGANLIPIQVALLNGCNWRILEKLLNAAPKDIYRLIDEVGNTILHLAVLGNIQPQGLRLLTNSDLVSATNYFGNTPLHLALCQKDIPDTVTMGHLIKKSPHEIVCHKNKDGNNLIHLLLKNGDPRCFGHLQVILHHMDKESYSPSIRKLLQIPDKEGFTPLMLGALYGNDNQLRMMLTICPLTTWYGAETLNVSPLVDLAYIVSAIVYLNVVFNNTDFVPGTGFPEYEKLPSFLDIWNPMNDKLTKALYVLDNDTESDDDNNDDAILFSIANDTIALNIQLDTRRHFFWINLIT